ncbi:MAG: leucine-rich repeat protein [Muribaculaceae bacterium]|nr:leucine-rich repeat protein [Muribaculaceae bacterium]
MKKILLLTVLFLMGFCGMMQAQRITIMNATLFCDEVYSAEEVRNRVETASSNPVPYMGSVSFDGPNRRLVLKNLNVVLAGYSFLYNQTGDSLTVEIQGDCVVNMATTTASILNYNNVRMVCADGASFKIMNGGTFSDSYGLIQLLDDSSIIFENGSFIFSKSSSPVISFMGDYEPTTPPSPVSSQFTMSQIPPKSVVFKNCNATINANKNVIVGMKGYLSFLDCDITSPDSYTFDSNGSMMESDGTSPLTSVTISPCLYFDAGGLWYHGQSDGSLYVTYQNSFSPAYTNLGSSVTVPSSVKHKGKSYAVKAVGRSAFKGCSGLQSVNLPSSIKTINGFAFMQCNSLKSMTIPENVENINGGAFAHCDAMTSVTIPSTVKSIGSLAFGSCYSLEKIYSHIYDPTKVSYSQATSVFNGVNKSTCILYVPKGRIWIYWDTDPWSEFNRYAEIPAANGDVNGDGKVNVSDVTTLINMILGVIPKDTTRGDINGDGNVNVSDVTALVNIILSAS